MFGLREEMEEVLVIVVAWRPRMKSFSWGRAAVAKEGLVVVGGLEDWN